MGRLTTFSDEVANEICERIACGESLASVCRSEDMPPMRTVMGWLRVYPEFRQHYARARAEQGESDADAVADIRQRMLDGEIDPQAARVAIDSLKWSAGKRLPKKYGDKLALVGGGPDDLPIRMDLSTLTDEELEELERIRSKLAHARGDPQGEGAPEG